jgi:tRNA (Thr-GGU) A37 N-methylase
MEFIMRPIGFIRSPLTEKDKTLFQALRSQALGLVELYPEFLELGK